MVRKESVLKINDNVALAILFLVIGSCTAIEHHSITQLKIAQLECVAVDQHE